MDHSQPDLWRLTLVCAEESFVGKNCINVWVYIIRIVGIVNFKVGLYSKDGEFKNTTC